jgi:hypothetical protein
LHPALIAEGFLDLLSSPKDALLFPGFTPDRFGSRAGDDTKTIGAMDREGSVSPIHARLRIIRRANISNPSAGMAPLMWNNPTL